MVENFLSFSKLILFCKARGTMYACPVGVFNHTNGLVLNVLR